MQLRRLKGCRKQKLARHPSISISTRIQQNKCVLALAASGEMLDVSVAKCSLTWCNADLVLLRQSLLNSPQWLFYCNVIGCWFRQPGNQFQEIRNPPRRFPKSHRQPAGRRADTHVLILSPSCTVEMQPGSPAITQRCAFSRQQKVEIPACTANVTEKSTLMHLNLLNTWRGGRVKQAAIRGAEADGPFCCSSTRNHKAKGTLASLPHNGLPEFLNTSAVGNVFGH